MPRPVFKKINIIDVISRTIHFVGVSSKSKININTNHKKLIISGDEEQLNRVFINLIKNSEESFEEILLKNPIFKGKIDIEINSNNDYIVVKIIDNGTGILNTKKAMTPYYTTKNKGSGLGLPIVSKIINEHSGDFSISNREKSVNGIIIEMSFPKLDA